jgi:UDP:flavonoid glycosyltransferase YjiC (YdhE family)
VAEILFAASPPIGHVALLLSVARALVNRGDDVTFLTSARHADKIRAIGAIPHPLPYGGDYDDSSFDADLPGKGVFGRMRNRALNVVTHEVTLDPSHQACECCSCQQCSNGTSPSWRS